MDWTVDERKGADRKTRKLLTLNAPYTPDPTQTSFISHERKEARV